MAHRAAHEGAAARARAGRRCAAHLELNLGVLLNHRVVPEARELDDLEQHVVECALRANLLNVVRDDHAARLGGAQRAHGLPQPAHEPPLRLGLCRVHRVQLVLEAEERAEQ